MTKWQDGHFMAECHREESLSTLPDGSLGYTNGLRLQFAATTICRAVTAAINNVLIGNLGSCALVNFLPRNVAGELLAELDTHRSTKAALAFVGGQHLGGRNGHFALLVLHVLYRGVQVGIDRQELVAYGDAETFQHVRLNSLHILCHRCLHNRRLNARVTTRLLANFVEGQCAVRYWHCVERVCSQLCVLFRVILHFCHCRKRVLNLYSEPLPRNSLRSRPF